MLVPESRSGLIIGDFEDQRFPLTTLASRDAIAKTPLPLRVSSCLAWIMGESHDSGHDLSLDGRSGFRRYVPERFLETPTQNRDQG